MKRIAALSLLAMVLSVGESCAELPTLEAGACGNGVVEPGEDCDNFPKGGCHAPGTAQECHFACAACPSGWGCDKANDVCREPVGAFASEPATTFETTALRLEAGDFDGDGRSDLLARSQADSVGRQYLRTFFFDGSGAPAKTLTIGARAISPAIFDFDGDQRSDLAFISHEAGVNVLQGRSDRTLAARAFSRFPFPPGTTARMVRVDGIEFGLPIPLDSIPVLFAEMMPGRQLIGLGITTGDPLEYTLASMEQPAGKMLGDPVAANILDGPGRECDELIWSWQEQSTLLWLEVCLAGNLPWIDRTAERRPKPLLTLPDGDVIKSAPVAVDLNRDGHVDLLIDGRNANYVAFGRGDGTFSAQPSLSPGSAPLARLECQPRDGASGAPLARTDCLGAALAAHTPLDKSQKPLVIFPHYVLLVASATWEAPGVVVLDGLPLASRPGAPWTVALIDDLNGNGFVDIAAASASTSDIDFFNGTPSILFNPARIPTDSPVHALTAADYDGDLINDLAFVETGAGGDGVDAISVAYGRPAGPPEPALRLGYFPGIIQAKSAKGGGYVTELMQLGILYKGQENTDLIAILHGEGDRQLLAPFGIGAPISEKAFLQTAPSVLVPGRFDNTGHVGVFALGEDIASTGTSDPLGTLRVWYTPGAAGGWFGDPIAGPSITTLTARFALATGRAADLTGDGVDEAVFVAPNESGGTPRLAIASVGGGKVTMSTPQPLPHVSSGSIQRIDLALTDVDGDGRVDAVIAVHSLLKSTIVVAWGDGAGGLDVAGATALMLPEPARPRAFATVQLDTDGALELLVATTEGTFAVQGAGRELRAARLLPAADAVVSADFDGDGLPDVALSNNHRVSIHLGVSP